MSKAARLLVLCLLAFGMAYSHAASFSKNGSSYLQVQGNIAKYTLSPQNTGALQFPNTGWQVIGNALASGLTIGKTQNLPVPVGAALPATVKAVVSPNSLAKSLVNPWNFVASMALQETLGYLATQACVRLAGGQMTNTGGLWEECITTERPGVFKVMYKIINTTALFDTPESACQSLSPWFTSDDDVVVLNQWHYDSNSFICIVTAKYKKGTTSFIASSKDLKSQWTCNGAPSTTSTCPTVQVKDWVSVPDSLAVAAKIEEAIVSNPSYQPSIFNDLYEGGSALDVSDLSLTGPSSVNAGQPVTVTKTNPDGSVETSTQQFVRNYTYAGDTVTHASTTTVNVTNNNGQTTTINTTTPNDSLAGQPQEVKLETCGLPGKPACKIDETGTPEAGAMDAAAVQAASAPLKTCLQDPVSCLPTLPDLNWTFSFPTGCSPIPLAGFAPFITSIDICEFQPVFHDLMSMVWAAVGLFLAAGMMFKEANGG